MAYASLSGFQYIGTYSVGNSYGSWPWAVQDALGNTHLVYRDWNGVTAAGHSTGGAGWYSRNGGTPVQKWNAASEGNQIQDTWVLPIQNGNLVFIIRLLNSTGPDYRHRYAVSTDAGVTIPTMANMPIPSGTSWTSGTSWAFADFCLSADGSKWYATAYDDASNVYLLQSSDGFTWSKKSTISTGLGNETSLIRFPDGRLLAGTRNATNTYPGYTCYSDDDGSTWTTPIQPNTGGASIIGNNFCISSPPRGIAVSNTEAVVLGRYVSGTGYVWHAQWALDRNGGYVSGPDKISKGDAAGAGYFCFSTERSGRVVYGYTDLNTTGADTMVFKANLRLSA